MIAGSQEPKHAAALSQRRVLFNHVLASVLFVMASSSAALAQSAAPSAAPPPAPPAIRTFTSSAALTEMLAKADKERKPGQANFNQPVLQLAPYRAVLETRVAPTPPLNHVTDAELIVVVDGSATMIIGGALVDPQPARNGNIAGTAIVGGAPMKIAKGDWIIVPENTPHWFQIIDGKLSMISLHLPREQKAN